MLFTGAKLRIFLHIRRAGFKKKVKNVRFLHSSFFILHFVVYLCTRKNGQGSLPANAESSLSAERSRSSPSCKAIWASPVRPAPEESSRTGT
jgi:hypothetical protein